MINELLKFVAKPVVKTAVKYAGIGLASVASGIGIKKAYDWSEKKSKEEYQKITQDISNNLLGDFIILDSNIWMMDKEDEYLIAFIYRFCFKNKKIITIPKFQLKEFQNPKNENDRYIKKTAKVRIEKFQDKGIVKIENYKQEYNYVDDSLLHVISQKKSSYNKISLITEDRELRIKAKALKNFNKNTLLVSSKSDLEEYHFKYLKFQNRGI